MQVSTKPDLPFPQSIPQSGAVSSNLGKEIEMGIRRNSATDAEVLKRRNLTNTDVVKIRSYESADEQTCREIFSDGMQVLINSVAQIVLPRYFHCMTVLSVFAILAGMQWSFWIFGFYILVSLMVLAAVYVVIYLEMWKFINSCLTTDLWNIDKSYMMNKRSHMFVAEWKGEVVGMVGLVQFKNGKSDVAELQRMSVSSKCRRMGIAKKLIDEFVKFAEEQRYSKVVLSTTSAQKPAVMLYTKYGFKHTDLIPFPMKTLMGFEIWQFELEL